MPHKFMMLAAIIGGIVGFCCMSIVLILRRFRTRKLELQPARQQSPIRRESSEGVVLRYASGTTVELDDVPQPSAAGSVVSPMPRRKMPGLMPTAGYVVVPKQRPSRSLMVPPKNMDFSDD